MRRILGVLSIPVSSAVFLIPKEGSLDKSGFTFIDEEAKRDFDD
jgi:hypothetical protein